MGRRIECEFFHHRTILVIMCCCVVAISAYNIHRTDNDDTQPPLNFEINFFPNYETQKIFEALEKDDSNVETSTVDYNNSVRSFLQSETDADSPFTLKKYFIIITATNSTGGSQDSPLDSWSLIWYVASFGGLIAFFLIVSCSEWCCKRPTAAAAAAAAAAQQCSRNASPLATVPDSPPPSYDQFAPPSYDSICEDCRRRGVGEKAEFDVFVVPVHALQTIVNPATRRELDDAPPSYLNANRQLSTQYPPVDDDRVT